MGSNLDGERGVRPELAFRSDVDRLYPDFEELLDAAEQVKLLMRSDGWVVLQRLLREEVAVVDGLLERVPSLDRELPSQAHYAAAHGRRGGLRAAEALLITLLARAETRLAEQRAKYETDVAESTSRG